MDPKIVALQNANSAAELKAAVPALPREEKYFIEEVRDLLIQHQGFITDAPTANSVALFLYWFSVPLRTVPLLRTPQIRDVIINVLAPRISDGDPVENLGSAVGYIAENRPAAELYSNPESFRAILSCFHRATTASSVDWIARSIYNIILYNPPDAKRLKFLNDLPVVEAFSALLPHATTNSAVMWVTRSLHKILFDNDEVQKGFGTPTFFEKFKDMEQYATWDATSGDEKKIFKQVVDKLQSIIDRPSIEKSLRDAKTSQELISALDSITKQSDFWPSLVDLLLSKKDLITDFPTADSVIAFLFSFSCRENTQSFVLTSEIRDLIINVLAPKISGGAPVDHLGGAVCNIVQDKPSAELYSTPESFKAILSCFRRATTAESVQWITTSMNNILFHNPSAQKFLNDLPVAEAFSALLPHATSDDAVEWVSHLFQKLLRDNDEAQRMFATPTFLEKFKTMEKYATWNDTKTSFEIVVGQLQSIIDRPSIEKSLRDANTAEEIISVLDSIMKHSCGWSSYGDTVLSKKHLIVDEESTTSAAKFIKWCCETKEKSIQRKEIYDLFENVLLPKSLIFTKSIAHVYGALALIVNNNKEAQEFFSTISFKVHVIASLPHADQTLLKIINSLLTDSKKAQEIFGTPDFKWQVEFKFRNNTSQEFTNVIKILNEQIIPIRLDALKKIAVDNDEVIGEECLKKLAENEVEVADLLVVVPSRWVQFLFTDEQNAALSRLIQKMKNKTDNGVSVHQDPFKLQELEKLRQEHDDLRKLHQDLITSSSKANDDLNNQLQDEKKNHATTIADGDAKQSRINDLDQLLVDEKKVSRDLVDANKKLLQEHNVLRKLHQDLITSTSQSIGDLEKLQQTIALELTTEKKNHAATTADRDAKILEIGSLTTTLDDTNRQLLAAQRKIANLQSQLASISPFVRDKFYQIDSNVNNLPQPQDVITRHNVATTTRIFAEAEKLMATSGALIHDPTSPNDFKFSPVTGFTLQSVDVILRSTSGFEDRLKKLLGFRLGVTSRCNPAFAAFSPEQQQVLKILFAHFLPRPSTANAKFPNLVNVFHGTRIDFLDLAMDGLRAMRSTDDGYFGFGCYTTTSIEYAAQYARGDFSTKGPAPTPRADDCYPVLWCVAAIGVCHPVSRADDYSQGRIHRTIGGVSNFFGSPLNKDCDCHCAVVGTGHGLQAVPPTDMDYMEIVVDQENQVIPIAVLWVK